MNLPRIYLIAIMFLAFGVRANGQDTPKAVLVDEFGPAPCEFLLAKADWYAAQLRNDPSATGYVFINPNASNKRHQFILRKLVSATLQLSGLDTDRFRFFLGRSSDGGSQFWLVPAGAEAPTESYSTFEDEKINLTRPVSVGYADDLDICPTFVPRAFAKLITDNPGSIGKIEIEYAPDPLSNRWYFAEEWIKKLLSHNVPRNRLRLTFRRGKSGLSANFVFVPQRRAKL